MANLDFTPLYRSTIGFDNLPRLMRSATRITDADIGYPPYNIEKLGEESYKIVIALAGFQKDDIDITIEENQLTINGKVVEQEDAEYLYRGIAGRSFERRFDLAEHIEVSGANFENGLLTINLKRELPEKLKPRQIEISSQSAEHKTIEASKDKAA